MITAHSVENVDDCSALRGMVVTVWLRCVPVGGAWLMAFRLDSEFDCHVEHERVRLNVDEMELKICVHRDFKLSL